MKKIALTGGGTAGHVNPNIALIPFLMERGYEIIYIGTADGIEKKLIDAVGIKYYAIKAGKLRRYLDWKNVTDIFKTISGVGEAAKILKKERVDVVFSKGGFVGVPVVLGAKLNRIPVVIHESDYTPGLANKLAIPFAKRVCVTFPETVKFIGEQKATLTGNPIRPALFQGDRGRGLSLCGFDEKKPVLLVIGGSLGSKIINDTVRAALPELLQRYQIIHICGKGHLAPECDRLQGYRQFEYVDAELPDYFKAAEMVISRAGANAVCEFLAIRMPCLLIPLSKNASRGDQILNAASFARRGYSAVLQEEDLTRETLLEQVAQLYKERERYIASMSKVAENNAIEKVLAVIAGVEKGK